MATTTAPQFNRKLWLVIAVLAALPALFRFASLGVGVGQEVAWKPLVLLATIFGGIGQDLVMAGQLVIACLCVRGLTRQKRFNTGLSIAMGLILLVFFFVLFDFLLQIYTGVRMSVNFLQFFSEAKAFWSSAQATGLSALAIGFGMLTSAIVFYFSELKTLYQKLEFHFVDLFLFSMLVNMTYFITQTLPADTAYRVNNVVVLEQLRWVQDVFGLGRAYRFEVKGGETQIAFPEEFIPQGEQFRHVSPKFPLLKFTEKFNGKKAFDIAVASGEKPHIVFLFMESFRAANVGVLTPDPKKHPGATPNFDRLSQEGILFSNFYANGVQTTRGVIASLFGILPRFNTDAVQSHLPDMPLIGVGDLLKSSGYRLGFFHNGSLEFEKKTEFFSAHHYDEIHGKQHIGRRYPNAERSGWGLHDEYLMSYVSDWMETIDKSGKSAFVTMFTVSNHHPWRIPKGYDAPDFSSQVGSGQYADYLQTMHYSDYALGLFVEGLKKRGLDKKTILVVLADTSNPMGEHHGNYMLINYLYEENLRIPLLILAPERIAQPKVIKTAGSQVDLLPTMMDILGLSGMNHAIGSSLMREPRFPRPLFANNPFALGYQTMVVDGKKLILSPRSSRKLLFDLRQDPFEQSNQVQANAALVAEMTKRIEQVHGYIETLYQNQAFTHARWRAAAAQSSSGI